MLAAETRLRGARGNGVPLNRRSDVPNDVPNRAPLAVDVIDLAKRFGDVQAVAGVDFEVRAGEIFGFLGPNGAGKTTTITMLIGLARPDRGTIRVAGIDCSADPKAAQHLIGVVPDESNLYPELTGFENLAFCGALYGLPRREREARARELLERFGLADVGQRRFAGYSKGMKRKLTIAAGIVHRPAILFLDEPTSGIDVASARHIRQLIADLNAGGTTVFLTTHYIEEAEEMADRVGVINQGQIMLVEETRELMRQLGRKQLTLHLETPLAQVPETLSAYGLTLGDDGHELIYTYDGQGDRDSIPALLQALDAHGIHFRDLHTQQSSLEEIFVSLVRDGHQ